MAQPQGSRNSGTHLTPAQKQERLRRQREQQSRRRSRHRALLGVLLLLIIGASFLAIKAVNGSLSSTAQEELDDMDLTTSNVDDEAEEALYDGPPVANILFVGDISTSADQVAAVTQKDGNLDFSAPFAQISSYISQADYAVGDFESTIVDGLSYGGAPYYNSPVELAGTLRALGFRLMSTANTYALNNGIDGLISTVNYLTEAKLRTVGTYLTQEARDTDGGAYIRNIHKIKFAFLSYTKGTDSVTMPTGCEYALNTLYTDYSDYWTELRSSQIRKDVQAAKDAGAEVIVALVHWGSEYGRTVRASQEEVTELLLENGVDVIIGTHSHLVSEMGFQEVTLSDGTKKNCFVAYGLGDFYTDPEEESAQQSLMLNLQFSKGDDGKVTITDASYVPTYMQITEENGKRQFLILDVYKNLAELKRETMTSQQATLYNTLLDTLDTLHTYAGEELDAGPADEDRRIVAKALEEGAVADSDIRALQKEEAAAAQEAEEEKAAETPDTTDETDETEED